MANQAAQEFLKKIKEYAEALDMIIFTPEEIDPHHPDDLICFVTGDQIVYVFSDKIANVGAGR